jgi:low temperature requirement protein LtrA
MSILGAHTSFLRHRESHEDARVTNMELFFDLVFVFAVTQLSHSLLAHLTPAGVGQAALLLMAVWWTWIFTSWATNWVDPDKLPVRLMLFGLMAGGLVVSMSIPEAFGERALPFALAYAAMQVGRSVFMIWALRHHNHANFRNFIRISIWLSASGAVWIAGALAGEGLRVQLWLAALAIEYAGPFARFWVPGLGHSLTTDWDVEGEHLAERCGLFVIIALGESILVTGATFAGQAWTVEACAAFLVAFVGSVAMWWIYFNIGADYVAHRLTEQADPGRMARLNYTYIPLLLIAGIIVCAVADEIVLMHPHSHAEPAAIAALLAGPALYVLGNALFKRTAYGRLPLSHLVGLGLLALLIPVALHVPTLALGAMATAVLVMVAVWETVSLGGSRKE